MSKIEVDAIEPQSGTTLTIGASGDTITIPSGATLTNSGTATGFGKVLQVVSATSTATASTSSLTFASLSFATSITPSSATSKIFVIMTFTHELSHFAAFNIDRNGTLLSNQTDGLGGEQAGSINMITTLQFLDSPNTTSPVTYTLFGRVSAGSVALQGNKTKSMVLMEIAP
jgi:hypothetical protein